MEPVPVPASRRLLVAALRNADDFAKLRTMVRGVLEALKPEDTTAPAHQYLFAIGVLETALRDADDLARLRRAARLALQQLEQLDF